MALALTKYVRQQTTCPKNDTGSHVNILEVTTHSKKLLIEILSKPNIVLKIKFLYLELVIKKSNEFPKLLISF